MTDRRPWLALALLVEACSGEGAASSAVGDRPRAPTPATATLQDAQGDVRWQRAAEAAWARAHRGLDLSAGDAVQTMREAAATVRFVRTGARAELGPQTTLRIPVQAPASARLRHLSGRLVAKLADGGREALEVELPPGTLVLSPQGSRTERPSEIQAQIEVDDQRTQIEMLQGAGRLDRPRGGSIALAEHHFVGVDRRGEVLEAGRIGARAEPAAPSDGATVRTRRDTRFAWAPLLGADSVRLSIHPASGASIHRTVVASETEIAVELPSGSYRWTVSGVVGGEPMPASGPRVVVVEVDRTPPALSVTSPAPGTTTTSASVNVAGRTDPGTTVEVDGRPVPVAADGRFGATVAVPGGLTNVVVIATDDLGNRQAISRTVLRE